MKFSIINMWNCVLLFMIKCFVVCFTYIWEFSTCLSFYCILISIILLQIYTYMKYSFNFWLSCSFSILSKFVTDITADIYQTFNYIPIICFLIIVILISQKYTVSIENFLFRKPNCFPEVFYIHRLNDQTFTSIKYYIPLLFTYFLENI